MALTISAIPNKQFAPTETLTIAKLNLLGSMTITVSGTASSADLATGAVTETKAQAGAYFFGTTAGTSTAYTLDLGAGLRPDSLANGVTLRAKLHTANGVAPTLNPTGSSGSALGAKTIRRPGDVIVSANDFANNQIVDFTYNTSYNSGGGAWVAQSVEAVPSPAIVADSRNLVVKSNASLPSQKVDVTADAILLVDNITDTNYHRSILRTSVSVSIDTQASNGANALDSGSQVANTWYYVYVIFNPTTGTTAGLMSTSATAPTMPSGYTYAALVSCIRCNSTNSLRKFWQTQRRLHLAPAVSGASFDTEVTFITAFTGPGIGTWAAASAAAGPTQAISALLPPIAKTAFGVMGETETSASSTIAVAGDDDPLYGFQAAVGTTNAAASYGFTFATPFEVPLLTSQDFYWSGQGTAVNRIVILGYTI